MWQICSCLEEAEELNSLKAPYFSKKNQFFPHRVISFLKTSLPFIHKKICS